MATDGANPGNGPEPSPYERRALRTIQAWRAPPRTWLRQAVEYANWPFDQAGDAIVNMPGVGEAIGWATQGILSVANDVAQWSVRPEAIYAAFRGAGHSVYSRHHIQTLDLEHVDGVARWLGARYQALALGEGASTGAFGALGMVADVPALILLNLRAIGEYATYCGLDGCSQEERLFAMRVLGLASNPAYAARAATMAQLVRITRDVAARRTWKQLEQHAFVKVIQQLAKQLGVRLTKAKLAQAVPAAGAFVGGGFNAYYTHTVCNAAYYLYRERFLLEKYGPDLLGPAVEHPQDNDPPGYEGAGGDGNADPE